MKKKQFICQILLLGLLSVSKFTIAQTEPDSIRFQKEISRIKEAYTDSGYLTFKSTYYYEDFDGDNSHRDTLIGSHMFSGNKMHFVMDSVWIVQNDQYQVVVYELDSLIQVNPPTELHKSLFQEDLNDFYFYQMNVSGVAITNVGANRKIAFTFLSNSPFVSYEITYDSTSYLLQSVSYLVKQTQMPTIGGIYSGPSISINVVYWNYSAAPFSDSIFSTNQFFTRKNGVFTPVAPYTGFSLINQTVED